MGLFKRPRFRLIVGEHGREFTRSLPNRYTEAMAIRAAQTTAIYARVPVKVQRGSGWTDIRSFRAEWREAP